MPTTFPVLTQAWALISSSQDVPINIQPKVKSCQWITSTTLPPSGAIGNTLNPEDFRTITLQSGDNLYAKSSVGTTELGVTI